MRATLCACYSFKYWLTAFRLTLPVISPESRRLVRHLVVAQCVAGAGLALALLLLAPMATGHGLAGWAAVASAVVVSGVVAMGGGMQGGAGAALRSIASVVLRWVLVAGLLVALAARPGAIVWAIAAGAVLAQLVFMATAVTFKRV